MSQYEDWVKAMNTNDEVQREYDESKITPLDHYAAAAITGLLVNNTLPFTEVVQLAFKIADICLEERKSR